MGNHKSAKARESRIEGESQGFAMSCDSCDFIKIQDSGFKIPTLIPDSRFYVIPALPHNS